MIEIVSIDITHRCSKQCGFCYNRSIPTGDTEWTASEVVAFAMDCIRHGVKAISLGGGEPFEHPEIFKIIEALYPHAYVTVTSNGLPLQNKDIFAQLTETKPDKIHLSLHNPSDHEELNRIVHQLSELNAIGIKPGVNLLVAKSWVESARDAYGELRHHLSASQIILLPMRYGSSPSAEDMKYVAGGANFQSASCLLGCTPPENFASITWDKKASRCSFAGGKATLDSLTFEGLVKALHHTAFKSCI